MPWSRWKEKQNKTYTLHIEPLFAPGKFPVVRNNRYIRILHFHGPRMFRGSGMVEKSTLSLEEKQTPHSNQTQLELLEQRLIWFSLCVCSPVSHLSPTTCSGQWHLRTTRLVRNVWVPLCLETTSVWSRITQVPPFSQYSKSRQ